MPRAITTAAQSSNNIGAPSGRARAVTAADHGTRAARVGLGRGSAAGIPRGAFAYSLATRICHAPNGAWPRAHPSRGTPR